MAQGVKDSGLVWSDDWARAKGEECGRPGCTRLMAKGSIYGVGSKHSSECKKLYDQRYLARVENLTAMRRRVAEWSVNPNNQVAIATSRDKPKNRAQRAKHDAERSTTPARRAINAKSRVKYYQRTDRPCRYAKSKGCTAFAEIGRSTCREHHNEDVRRQGQRTRDKLKQKLAARQGGVCTWCWLSLPDDLSNTHVDHVYPKALWLLDEDFDMEWNLECLHGSCNESKNDKLTDRAIELMAEHGYTVSDWGSRMDVLAARRKLQAVPEPVAETWNWREQGYSREPGRAAA